MYTDELFTDNSTDLSMEKNKIAPLSSSLKKEWSEIVVKTLKDSEIEVPKDVFYSLKIWQRWISYRISWIYFSGNAALASSLSRCYLVSELFCNSLSFT